MLCSECHRFRSEVAQILHDSDSDEADGVAWPSHKTRLYDNVAELKAASRSSCIICRCILNCLLADPKLAHLPLADYVAILELSPDQNKPVLRVHFEDASPTASPALQLTRLLAIYSPSLNKSPALAATLVRCAELENDSTGSDASFELANFWLRECLTNHPRCSRRASGWLPTRVVDVGPSDGSLQPRLIETQGLPADFPASARTFVALSHCWGKQQIITTKKATLEVRKDGIAMAELSPTFRNAVVTTRRLGQRFLWIDSLCIVQDSDEDWNAESVKMCDIYQRAIFTIAAANGEPGSFVQRDGRTKMPFEIRFGDEGPGDDCVHHDRNAFFLPISRTLYDPYRGRNQLYSRAWVLQEQLLSRALLVYKGDQLSWECLTARGSEGDPDGGLTQRDSSMMSITNAISSTTGGDPFGQEPLSPYALRMHKCWCDVVTQYTHRGMTKMTDRLIAAAGIAQAIHERTTNRYLAGLWSDQLLVGLTWKIPWDLKGTLHGDETRAAAAAQTSSRQEEAPAPSWSWASVTLPVSWDTSSYGTTPDSHESAMEAVCDVVDVDVRGPQFKRTGNLTIRGPTRRLYVDPFYQEFHFSGKAKENPKIKQLDIVYKDAHVTDLGSLCYALGKKAKHRKDFSLFPFEFCPDELLDRYQEVTFIAIGELPPDTHRGIVIEKDRDTRPSILALALLPTGRKPNEYRRVGLSRWYNCSWYGYYCVGPDYKGWNWRDVSRRRSYNGWVNMLRECVVIFIVWLLGTLLNQPIAKRTGAEMNWFSQLVNGRGGRHSHDSDAKMAKSYRKGSEAPMETLTIV